ncbi:uncharacterized protein KGF55_004002 [Candida pseudojiufengensis]|uniref:uncharacterized protein n=1 Tax=Candida pseudojiufengensis TaxID=497109 RepID=UPI002224CCB7|nr:uncharacterized protein KGF55_004002 [Candida pseudojiufengensis]KAI5961379.1 hypothetical protein KGF55_004002 [Candida pseudojiufengensis]
MSSRSPDPTSPKNSQFLNSPQFGLNNQIGISASPIQSHTNSPSQLAVRTNTHGSTSSLSSLTELSSTALSRNTRSGQQQQQLQQPKPLESAESILQKQSNNTNNNNNNEERIIEEDKEKDTRCLPIDLLDYKSLRLENKGSVARDHMANERTFLAWLRTSLSFITLGIGITQLFRLEKPDTKIHTTSSIIFLNNDHHSDTLKKFGKPLGGIFIIIGIITLFFGFNRYFYVQKLLTTNYYPATRLGIMLLIFLIASVILITLGMILETSLF